MLVLKFISHSSFLENGNARKYNTPWNGGKLQFLRRQNTKTEFIKCKAITGQLHKSWRLELFKCQLQLKECNHAFDKNINLYIIDPMGENVLCVLTWVLGIDLCLSSASHFSSLTPAS